MVFVTGGNGMVGAHLIQLLLAKGEKVLALKRTSSDLSLLGKAAENVQWINGDILDASVLNEALNRVREVYHVAALISFDKSEKQKMYKTNIEGTANIVNACLDNNIDKLVHVSSISALSYAKENQLLDESAQWEDDDIQSGYAECKFLGEMEVWRGMAEGLKAVIVNPTVVVGPSWWLGTGPSAIFKKVDEGLPVYTSGSNGYVDVRDVVELMYLLMKSPIVNERFILNAENLSYKEFIGAIAENLNKKPPRYLLSAKAGFLISYIDTFRSFLTRGQKLLTPEMIKIANKKMLYSNQKICKTLSYSFRPMKTCIADTAKSYAYAKAKNINFGNFQE